MKAGEYNICKNFQLQTLLEKVTVGWSWTIYIIIFWPGTAFKVGKSYNQAKDAFLKAADAYAKNHSYLFIFNGRKC
jgi:hypothetical protein